MKTRIYLVVTFILLSLSLAQAQEHQKTDTHKMSGSGHDEMNKRGDKVMGFEHSKTTHHFILLRDGGAIEVNANQPEDASSRDDIRSHLSQIAMMFGEGNFKAPMLIHGQEPPGVPVMKRLKNEIKYDFEKTERGARVRISTENPEALHAIHDFLRFQITEHKTGDALEVK